MSCGKIEKIKVIFSDVHFTEGYIVKGTSQILIFKISSMRRHKKIYAS